MDQIVKEVHEAACEGNVVSLVNLVEKDRLILDRCMVISYGETPLHIATMLGHLEFCKDLLRLKPELAEELDSRRSSALHLASAKGFTGIVKLLVSVCPKMGVSFDEDGKKPIHVAAMKGRVGVLQELVNVQPDAAHTRVEMGNGETVLHLCVQYSQLEALRFLVEHLNDEELVNARDDKGNSILHLALFDKQVQIVNYLVKNTKIDVNAVNLSGLKALDILAQTRRDSKYIEIYDCLRNHASSEHVEKYEYPSSRYQKLPKSKDKNKASKRMNKSPSQLKEQKMWLDRKRDSLMIVAVLIATMGFQATLSPPGGFWQETNSKDCVDSNNHTITCWAGNSVFADRNPSSYKFYMITNSVGFISSLTVILFLISGLPYTHKVFMWILMVTLWISISSMAWAYALSIRATVFGSSQEGIRYVIPRLIPSLIAGWLALMALLFLMHTIRLICRLTRRWGLKLRVFMWTLVVILWILLSSIVVAGAIAISRIGFESGGTICLVLFIVLVIKLVLLLVVFGVPILIIKSVKKLIRFFSRMKEAMMKSSRSQDNIIVVYCNKYSVLLLMYLCDETKNDEISWLFNSVYPLNYWL